ncbi:MAG: hypothetical protein NZL96_03630 [Patescibacteria group bacterium]|nr:hypothetical protein [Patescibacteria group bacterium]
MKAKKTDFSLIDDLLSLQKKLKKKPSYEEMFDQLKMMNLTLKPINGQLADLDFLDKNLIEMIWGIGKLEEFFYSKINQLKSEKEREKFVNLFTQIYNSYYQNHSSQISFTKEKESQEDSATWLEIEIYKVIKPKN